MVEFFRRLFSPDFMPHGHCFGWDPAVVWLNVLSDGLITTAYYSIPITLAWFIYKRRDVPFSWIFIMFAGFIVACGTTHLMEIWTVWHGTYRLAGVIKAVTAILSISTAALLFRVVPLALALRSPTDLAKLNAELEREIAERRRVEEELRYSREELEDRVRARTQALAEANQALQTGLAERREAADALRQSDERLRATFDQAAVGLAHVSPEGRWLRVNQKLCDIVGYTAEQLRTLRFQDITHPDDLETDMTQVRRMLANEIQTYALEKRYIRRDARLCWVNLTVSLVWTAPGQPKYFIAVVEDINRRKQAERELAHLAAVVQSSDDAIIGMTPDGRVRSWNPGAHFLFGYTADEMEGRAISTVVPRELQEETARLQAGLSRGERFVRIETKGVRKDAEIIDVAVTISPICDDGRVVGASMVARDITERSRAALAMRHSLREKETLLKEIHHRVKNNMQLISSLLQLQSGYIRNPEALAIFQESRDRIRSMALIHEKLYQSDSLAQIDLAGYVRGLVGILLRTYDTKAQAVRVESRIDGVLLNLEVAVPIGLILNELISNSLKHAFPGDRAGHIQISLHLHEGAFELVVRDDGVGCPPDFDWRESSSLGLRLIRILAEQLQGVVTMRSGPGVEFRLAFQEPKHTQGKNHPSCPTPESS
jgi:PAS domain S-box-containing protein